MKNFDLGVCMNDELKEEFIRTTSIKKCEKSQMNCLHLKLKTNNLTQMSKNANNSYQNLNITNNNSYNRFLSGMNGDTTTIFSGNYDKNYEFELSQTEEQLKRFLDIEKETKETLIENENYKDFLEYMEKNYKNQFDSQKLTIKDLKLQLMNFEIKTKAFENGMNQKIEENNFYIKNFEIKNKEFNDIYSKLKQAERDSNKFQRKLEGSEDQIERLKKLLEIKNGKLENKIREFDTKEKKYLKIIEDLNKYLDDLLKNKRDLTENLLKKDEILKNMKKRNGEVFQENFKNARSPIIPKTEFLALKRKLNMKNKLIEEDKNKQNRLQKDLHKNNYDKEDLERRILYLKKQLERGNSDIRQKNKDILTLEDKLRKSQKNNSNLKGEVFTLKNENNNLNEDLRTKSFKNKQLDEDIKSLNHKNDKLNNKIKEMKKAYQELKAKYNLNDNELVIMKEKEQKCMKLKEKMQIDLKEKEEKIVELENLLRKEEGLKKRSAKNLDHYKMKYNELEDEFDKLKKLNRKLKGESGNMMDELSEKLAKETLKNQILGISNNKLEVKLDELQKRLKNENSENSDLEDKLEELNDKFLLLTNDNEKNIKGKNIFERDFKKYKNLYDNSEFAKDELEADYKNLIKDYEKEKKENVNHETKIAKLEKKINKLESDINDASTEAEKEKHERKKYHTQYLHSKQKHDEEQFKNTNLEKKIAELELLITELKKNEGMNTKLKESQDRFTSMNAKYKENQRELEITIEQNTKISNDFNSLQKEYNELKEEYTKLSITYESSKLRIEGLESDLEMIFSESFFLKNKVTDIYEFLVEGEVGEHEQNPVGEIEKSLFVKKILEFLKNSSADAKEVYDEVEILRQTVGNLKTMNASIQEKSHQLEAKNVDLSKRHDRKTDMLGKITVKCMVLLSEIERIHINNSK